MIDHLAKLRIAEGRMDDWLPAFEAAAHYPNVYCKLSGLVTEADWQNWKPADLRPYVDRALELFGPRRCLFGSDWPVCLLAGSYEARRVRIGVCPGSPHVRRARPDPGRHGRTILRDLPLSVIPQYVMAVAFSPLAPEYGGEGRKRPVAVASCARCADPRMFRV